MKILYLIDTRLNDGGAPISSHILAKEMAKNGEEVFIIMPCCNDKNLEDNLICYRHIKKFWNSFPFEFFHPIQFIKLIFKIEREIKDISPDIIHAEMPRVGRVISILNKLNKLESKTKLVFTDREYVVDLKKIYKFLYKQTIAKEFDMIINLSNSATIFWKNALKHGKYVTIPNPGGNLFDTYSEEEYEKAFKIFPEIPLNRINIIFVGRMTWEKRWDLAKKVIFKLNEKLKNKINIIIVLAYTTQEQEKEVKNYILDLIKEKNIYIYQNLGQKELSFLYYLSDIHCITSSRESFGRTAIEAMSRKTIVISTDGGAIKETIGRKEFIINDEPNSIVACLEKYILDKKLLENEKEIFYKYYQNKYTVKFNYKSHKQIYEKLLENKN